MTKLNNPKQCNKCNKKSYEFATKNTCVECRKNYKKQWRLNNKEKIILTRNKYNIENKEKIKQQKKIYYINNKEKLKLYKKKYYYENKSNILEKSKVYYLKNKEKILNYYKEYYQSNKRWLYKYRKDNLKQRIKQDPSLKLRESLSNLVRHTIRNCNSIKAGKSILNYLPYTIKELKTHLESLFEPWMNWDNWGIYSLNIWNDLDSSTWTWQIDHIIPQSKLLYDSMEHENFQKCWSLENLRPLSSKENCLKGNRIL